MIFLVMFFLLLAGAVFIVALAVVDGTMDVGLPWWVATESYNVLKIHVYFLKLI